MGNAPCAAIHPVNPVKIQFFNCIVAVRRAERGSDFHWPAAARLTLWPAMMSAAAKSVRQSRLVDWVCCATLVAGIWAVYWPVTRFEFINLDDGNYVTANSWVKSGLSWKGFVWAFTTIHSSNWHPGAWISHMVDYQLYGLAAGGHHVTNVLLHTANAVLLFVLLKRLTGLSGWSFLAAALFAWHPLRVESVAWVAERKDVLSSFFGLLALLSYARYARQDRAAAWAYWGAVAFFVMSLLCKSTWVTLPFVFWLLDYWPLRRFAAPGAPPLRKIILEKAPFLALSAASCVVTFIVQNKSGSVLTLNSLPFGGRLANALVSYLRYVGKVFWPSHLSIIYPYPGSWPATWVAGAVAFLVVVSAAACLARRSAPWLAVGWFWFLGTLVPVIGLVQVGVQSMADRYTYLPGIGLCIVVACGLADAAGRFRYGKIVCSSIALLALVGCLWVTSLQISYWHDSERLFKHAIAVTEGNFVAYDNLGMAVKARGDSEQAMQCYAAALRCKRDDPLARNNLAGLLMAKGRLDEAEAQIEEAVADAPKVFWLYYSLGELRQLQGKTELAMDAFRQAIALREDLPDAHFSLGCLLQAQGKLGDATVEYHEALRQSPDLTNALNNLAWVLATCPDARHRDGKEALALAFRALKLMGANDPGALDTLAAAYAECGEFAEAARTVSQAISAARAAGNVPLAGEFESRLRLYQQSQPFREAVPPGPVPAGRN
jgi:protein O-mannosyl-transferase